MKYRRNCRLLVQTLERRLAPALFTVTNLADSGAGSLRQAVLDANALAGMDTIDFADSGTITLTSGSLTVTDPVNIDGKSAITVSGTNDRLITMSIPGAGAMSSISNLILTKGAPAGTFNVGGGINVDNDALTLTNVSIINCSAPFGGAVYVFGGTLKVDNCFLDGNSCLSYIYGNGGAICAAVNGSPTPMVNIVEINNSTISNNNAWVGGGIFFTGGGAQGKVSVTGSTIKGNLANAYSSPGSLSYGRAGGISASGNTIIITDSTISGNTVLTDFNSSAYTSAGGAGLYGNSVTISNTTISSNVVQSPLASYGSTSPYGGGLVLSATNSNLNNCTITKNSAYRGSGVCLNANINMSSTIVAQNGDGTQADIAPVYFGGPFTLTGNNNLVGLSLPNGVTITGSNNLIGTGPAINAKLGPLANNGGPTQTHALLAGSPAINAGINTLGLPNDQRGPGYSRVSGSASDIGAFEGAAVTAVAISSDVTSSGGITQTIQVTYTASFALVDVSSLGTGDITVTGAGGFTATPTLVSVNAAGNGRIRIATYQFTPPGGSWDAADNGAYTIAQAANQVFDTSSPPIPAGAATLTTISVTAPSLGFIVDHAVDENDGITTAGNLSLREAIALANANSGVSETIGFDPLVFSTPQSLMLTLGQMSITDGVTIIGPAARLTIDANQASRILDINAANKTVAISNLTLTKGSVADGNGGGIRAIGTNLGLSKVTISNCSAIAGYSGGGMAFSGTVALSIVDGTLSNNTSTYYGGGLYLSGAPTVTISRTTMAGNQTTEPSFGTGGAIGSSVSSGKASMTVIDSAITNNSAEYGGGIFFRGISAIIRNTTISGNTANSTAGGVAVYQVGSNNLSILVQTSTIAFNKAGADAGGIAVSGSASKITTVLESSIISGNSAPTHPDVEFGPNTVKYSLIGNTAGATISPNTNLLNVDPLLAPLANNGGPTLTHRLMPGSPAINKGSNVLALTYDQRGNGYTRAIGTSADIGSYEVQSPPQVIGIDVNEGLPQRSRVTSLTIYFDRAVALPANPSTAFQLQRQSDGALVTLTAAPGPYNNVTLTFTGGPVDGASLADGRYTLTAFASQITTPDAQLDGNGDGVPGDNYVLVGDPATNKLFRLFGDADGNGIVDGLDFGAFRSAFNTNSFAFDFDGNGVVDGTDFGEFRARFGMVI